MARTQTERAVIDLVINGQQAKTNLKEITLEMTRQRSALLKLNEADNPAEYKARLDNYHKLLAAQREMKQRIDDTSTAWGRFKKEMGAVTMGVVGGNVITFALQQLAALIPGTIDHTMKLKDAFADMAKATGLSEEGVKKLNKELKSIDTRTTNSDLRAIAVAGGQLGVANKEMVEFVTNVDKAVVALGDEFSGGVDQVAKELGGIGKLFDETKDMSAGKVINDVGSALNELGAAGSATSPVIAEFTTRMGQLGGLAPKLTETLGLGAALQELGLTAEIASSGLSGLMLTAANKSDLFAQHLGMSKKAVEDLINTSPNQFLMTLAKSFEGLAPAQVAQRLKELKVESQESIKVMSLLAGQTDLVAKKQALAADAMAKGTSLSEEAAKKNYDLAKDLKNLNEWFNSLLTSEAIQSFLVTAIHNAAEFIKVMPQIGQWLSKNAEWFGIAATATMGYYVAVTRGTAAAIANTIAETYRRVAYEVGFRWLVITTAAQSAYATVMAASTAQARLAAVAQIAWSAVVATWTGIVSIATKAQAAFNFVLSANPIGIVIVALTALVAAIKYFSEHTDRAIAVERKLNALRDQGRKYNEQSAVAMKAINDKMAHYNDLSSVEQANLKKTIALKMTETQARLQNVYAKAREIARQNAEPNLWQRMKVSASSAFQSDEELKRNHDRVVEENKAQAYGQAKLEAGEAQMKSNMDQLRDNLAEIQRMDSPKAKASGGKLNAITDPDKKDKAGKKVLNQAKQDAKELEKMLADARQDALKAEQSDYDKAVFAFAEKYTKMYELAKGEAKSEQEIARLSNLEMAAIQKAHNEKMDEERQKEIEKDNKIGFDASLREAELNRASANQSTQVGQAGHKVGEDEGQMQKLQADQVYLTQKLLLEQTFAQESADTQKELTDNWNAQVLLRAQTEYAAAEQMKHVEWELQDAKRGAMAEGVGILKGFLKENTIAYKAAIVAQKAFAIAQIIIDTQREITGLAASPATLLLPPGLREAYVTAKTVEANVRMGIGIATVAATGFSEIAAKKDGGFTGVNELYPGQNGPSGFTNGPTLFNMGRRSYVAGEAGREFVISNKALQNPAVANFAGMMDVMQRSNNYSMLSTGAASPGGGAVSSGASGTGAGAGTGDAAMMAMLAGMNRLEAAIKEQGSRPQEFNYRLFEDYQNDVLRTRIETKL